MRVLVGADIVIDYLRMREPFYSSAELLMALGQVGEFSLWMSPSQLDDLFYALTGGGKKSRAAEVRADLIAIRSFINICTIGQDEVDQCLRSDWPDVKDSLMYQAARSIDAEVIVTRGKKDFSRSRIPVFDCDELFAWLSESRGISYSYLNL